MRMWSCLNLAAAQAGPGALTREGQELCLPQEALVPSVYAMCGYRDISLSIAAAGPLSRSQDGFSREQRAIFPGKQSPASLPLSSLAEGHGSAGGRAWYLHAGAQLPRDAASGAWCFIHGPVAPAPPHPARCAPGLPHGSKSQAPGCWRGPRGQPAPFLPWGKQQGTGWVSSSRGVLELLFN